MSNAPNTPLRLPDDDRILLRQIAATCRDLDGQAKDLRNPVQTVNSRLDAMEGNRDAVGKLDGLILAVAEVQQDMREVKERLSKIETEMKNVRRYARTSIGELTP